MKKQLNVFIFCFLLTSTSAVAYSYSDPNNIEKIRQNTSNKTEIAQIDSPEFRKRLQTFVKEITVKVTADDNQGSGTLLAKQAQNYLVLTNYHVIRGKKTIMIQTYDGKTHKATLVSQQQGNLDSALLSFTSEQDYTIPPKQDIYTGLPNPQQLVIAAGYSAETGEFVTSEGKIEQIPDQSFREGYQIGSTSEVVQGMNGGPLIEITNLALVGINGLGADPIVNTGYLSQEGKLPDSLEQYRRLSWGIPLQKILASLENPFIQAYSLPLPDTTPEVLPSEALGWVAEIEKKAQQFTVKIENLNNPNDVGSGVIIAKEENSYSVLTANHVICQKVERKCVPYQYQLVTPDGKTYKIDPQNISQDEGVDLAVIQFSSTETYQVATLGKYNLKEDNWIFVAGYPKPGRQAAKWEFSSGLVFAKEGGILNLKEYYAQRESSSYLQDPTTLTGGYELVYSNITYGGMSGGAVLDSQGQVIGIHGASEGEKAVDSQEGESKTLQIGYSLGIPIKTFFRRLNQLNVNILGLNVKNTAPSSLSKDQITTLAQSLLTVEVPKNTAKAVQWIERGNQLWRLFRVQEAIAAYDRAIQLNPPYVHLAWYGKGLALAYQGQLESALSAFEQAVKVAPDYYAALKFQSVILSSLNKNEQALAILDKALTITKDNPDPTLYNEKGIVLVNLGQYTEAARAFTEAIKLSPRAGFYNNRGNLLALLQKWELAIADYSQAIDINSEDPLAYYNRGSAYKDQKNWTFALNDYNQAIALNPRLTEAYLGRGIVKQAQGDYNGALTDYNQAIAINPQEFASINNIGLIQYENGQVSEAMQNWQKSRQLNPQFPEPLLAIATVLYSQGKTEQAYQLAEEALKKDKSFGSLPFLKDNLWGAKLLKDAEKMLSTPRIQALLR